MPLYKTRICLILFIMNCLTCFRTIAAEFSHAENAVVIPHEVIFKLKDGKTTARHALAERMLQRYDIDKIEPVPGSETGIRAIDKLRSIYYAHFTGSVSPFAVAAQLRQDPVIDWAEPRFLYKITATPNDPMFAQQNFMGVIAAEQAWNYVKGEQGDVVIAVVDGGTDIYHPDLVMNLWVNTGEIPSNNRDDDLNGFIDDLHGWNFATNQGDPTGLSTTPINADPFFQSGSAASCLA